MNSPLKTAFTAYEKKFPEKVSWEVITYLDLGFVFFLLRRRTMILLPGFDHATSHSEFFSISVRHVRHGLLTRAALASARPDTLVDFGKNASATRRYFSDTGNRFRKIAARSALFFCSRCCLAVKRTEHAFPELR
jgi:hypothetical protein